MLWFRAQLEFLLERYAADPRILGALKDVCNVDARLHFSYRSRELYQELQESSNLIDSVFKVSSTVSLQEWNSTLEIILH